MAVTMITVFWDVTPCRVVQVPMYQRNLSTTLHGALPQKIDGFGGLVVSMLASGTQVCGFKPGRSRWIFRV